MKKIIAILLCLTFVLGVFAACNKTDVDEQPDNTNDNVNAGDETTGDETTGDETTGDETTGDENVEDEPAVEEIVDEKPVLDLEGVEALRYTTLGQDAQYSITNGDIITSYFFEPFETFLGVCKYFEKLDYTLYGYNVLGGLHSATYVKKTNLYHVYWSEGENKLNVIASKTSGSLLPDHAEDITGDVPVSVTQIQSPEINGQGYVIQLPDGSFIINDGGYAHRADEVWNVLVDLNGGEEGIVIRAWLLTHAHGDHTPCFATFATKYGSKVKLELLMIGTTSTDHQTGNGYLTSSAKKDAKDNFGADTLYVHTGMVFQYGDVTMEILFSPADLYMSEPYEGYGTTMIDFNNTSTVMRVYNDEASMIFLGDMGDTAAYRMLMYYGEYLQSDMVQISHHGVEDFPLSVYSYIKAAVLFYPCSQSLYDQTGRDNDVRQALKNSVYTKEILLQEGQNHKRLFSDVAAMLGR